jgi:very-short-patch-repair endonuclease
MGIYLPRDESEADRAAESGRSALAHVVGVHERLTADHWFSHETAAMLWGLPLVAPSKQVHVLQGFSAGSRSDPRVAHHVARVDEAQLTSHLGLPVTTLEQTVVDCARVLSPLRGLVIADAALAAGANSDTICALVDLQRGRNGARRARTVFEFADGGAESPGESFTRYVLLRDGFPRPVTQVEVVTRLGTFWADLGWEEIDVLLEYDGRSKYLDQESLVREKRRHDAIVESGRTVLRVTKEDLRGTVLRDRILAALPADVRPALRPRRDLRA